MSEKKSLEERVSDLEEKLDRVRRNIIMMSFYTDLKIIEGTIHRCKLHGIKIDPELIDALKEFKKHLYGDKNIFTIGRKYTDLAEKYFALRKEIYQDDDVAGDGISKEELEELMKSYV